MELLWLASQAPAEAEKKLANAIALYAPWMRAQETDELLQFIALTPDYQKARTSQELGDLVHLKNAEARAAETVEHSPMRCDRRCIRKAEQGAVATEAGSQATSGRHQATGGISR
jgi:hypothetical protein